MTTNHLPAMAAANSSVSVQASAFSSSSSVSNANITPSFAGPPRTLFGACAKDNKDTATVATINAKSLATVTPSPTNFSADAAASIAAAAPTPASDEATTISAKNSSSLMPNNKDDDAADEYDGRIIEIAGTSGNNPPPTAPTSLACLAELCASILTESKKKRKSNDDLDQHEEGDEYGNDVMPSSSIAAANTTIASVISPSNSNAAVAHRSAIDTSSLLINTTTNNDDEIEQKQPAIAYEDTREYEDTLSSPTTNATAKKKTRPTTLFTEDHPFEMNKTHCYLLKDILELYYVDTTSTIAKKKKKAAVSKSTTTPTPTTVDAADEDMTTTTITTQKRRRTKTAKAMAWDEAEDEDEGEENGFDEKEDAEDMTYEQGKEEDDAPADDTYAPSPLPAKKRRKTLTSAKTGAVGIGGKKDGTILYSEATNLCAVRCKFCRKEQGTGTIWVKSVSEQHVYVKIAAFPRLHLQHCAHCPPAVLAKFNALKTTESKRGRKSFWVSSMRKQGFVTVVDEAGRPMGISFKE